MLQVLTHTASESTDCINCSSIKALELLISRLQSDTPVNYTITLKEKLSKELLNNMYKSMSKESFIKLIIPDNFDASNELEISNNSILVGFELQKESNKEWLLKKKIVNKKKVVFGKKIKKASKSNPFAKKNGGPCKKVNIQSILKDDILAANEVKGLKLYHKYIYFFKCKYFLL